MALMLILLSTSWVEFYCYATTLQYLLGDCYVLCCSWNFIAVFLNGVWCPPSIVLFRGFLGLTKVMFSDRVTDFTIFGS
jgi:hypothetical protein